MLLKWLLYCRWVCKMDVSVVVFVSFFELFYCRCDCFGVIVIVIVICCDVFLKSMELFMWELLFNLKLNGEYYIRGLRWLYIKILIIIKKVFEGI